MDKILGLIFFIFAGLTIYDGGVFFFPGIPMQAEGGYRYFYAIPNILIGLYLFIKKKDIDKDVYTCEECDNAFWEKDIDNDVCPNCGAKVKNIKSKVPKNLQI